MLWLHRAPPDLPGADDNLVRPARRLVSDHAAGAADHLAAVNGAAVTSDANGSVTQDETGGTYTWDVRGRLVGLTKGGKTYAFQYGPDGLRLNKSVGGVLTTYLLDGGQVVTDTIGGTAYQTLYGPGTDHAIARNGEFFLPNSLGSTALLTDSSGNAKQSYQYSPFGGLLNSPTDNNPFQFTGRENDGSGLLYYRARYYNPGWGRFVSADPLGFGGGINPYVYAGNDPVNHGDPSGEQGIGHPGDGIMPAEIQALIARQGEWAAITPPIADSGAAEGGVGGSGGAHLSTPGAAFPGAGASEPTFTFGPSGPMAAPALPGSDDSNPYEAAMDASDANFGNPDEPVLIWRSGDPSPSNLRAGLDGTVSFRSSLSDPLGPGGPVFTKPTYFAVDVSGFPDGSVVNDNDPPGHVYVATVSPDFIKEHVVVRGKFPKDFPPGW